MVDRHPVPEWSDIIADRDRQIATLRRALLEAAEKLDKAGWRQSADLARDCCGMSDDITIPDEALKAMRAKLPPFFSESMALAACLAMLKHWPGMHQANAVNGDQRLILPLHKENTNG